MALIGNINFKDHDNEQSIYATQIDGTFFMVYARIKKEYIDDTNVEQLNQYKVDKIDIRIQNYKGQYNFGLTKFEFQKENDGDGNPSGGRLKIEVQALGGSIGWETVDVDQEFTIGESFLDVDRRVRPMHFTMGIQYNNVVSEDEFRNFMAGIDFERNGIFDSVYYYREGRDKPELKRPLPDHWDAPNKAIVSGHSCPGAKNKTV